MKKAFEWIWHIALAAFCIFGTGYTLFVYACEWTKWFELGGGQ